MHARLGRQSDASTLKNTSNSDKSKSSIAAGNSLAGLPIETCVARAGSMRQPENLRLRPRPFPAAESCILRYSYVLEDARRSYRRLAVCASRVWPLADDNYGRRLLVMHVEETQGRLLGSSVVYLSTCLSLSPRRWLGVEHPDSL